MTTPTAKPVPSDQPADLLFNAEKLDEVVNSTAFSFVDRIGLSRRTVAGLMAALNTGVDAVEARVAPALASIAQSADRATQAVATVVQAFHEKLDDVSLPEDLDATMVAFAGRSVQLALKDLPTIQQFGGAGDFDAANPSVYTNNYNALVAAINTGYVDGRPRGRNVRLPFVMGQTNRYRFDGGSIPRGYVTLVPDAGVEIVTDTVGMDDVIRGHVRYNGTGQTFSPYGDPRSGVGELDRPEYLKALWPADSDRYRNVSRTLSPSLALAAVSVAWPGGDKEIDWLVDAETTLGSTDANFAPSVGDGRIHLVTYRPKVGETISSQLVYANGQGGFIPWVLARTAQGHHGISFNPGNNAVSQVGKRLGQAQSQVGITDVAGLADHQSYFGSSALVEIRLDSMFGFSIMFNGLVVLQYEFPEPILQIGFGAYASAPTAFTWTNFATRIGGPRHSAKTRTVHVLADSRGADRYDAWPRFFKEAANGSAGVRVPRVTNQGVPGQGSSDQKAILEARAGQAGYTAHGFPTGTTDVLIAVGTNDIQGMVSPQAFRNNLVDIVTWARADGIVPFLGIPEVWYQRTNSGGTGQASQNYAAGTPYRAAVQSVAAQFGVVTVDDGTAMGPLIANYVNAGLLPSFIGADPMLMDNIHPGAFAGRIKGLNWAKAFLGHHAGIHPARKSEWQVLDATLYLNGWTPGADPVRWRVLEGDRIQWGGFALLGTVASGSADVFVVPKGLKPLRNFRGVASSGAAPVRANVGAAMTVFDIGAGASYVDFSAISYDLD